MIFVMLGMLIVLFLFVLFLSFISFKAEDKTVMDKKGANILDTKEHKRITIANMTTENGKNNFTAKEKLTLLVVGLLIIAGIVLQIDKVSSENRAREEIRRKFMQLYRRNPEAAERWLNTEEPDSSFGEAGQCSFAQDCW